MILAGEGQSWSLSPRNGARDAIVSVLLALCIRCPNALPMLSSIHLFGSHGPYGDYCRGSLCILALDGLYHHTEQDWNLTRIRSRTHVSIITDLMRTMNLLLACVHHPLNPQPKAIIFITMSVAIVFPLRPLWVV